MSGGAESGAPPRQQIAATTGRSRAGSSSSSSGRPKASPTIRRNADLLALDGAPDVGGVERRGSSWMHDRAAAGASAMNAIQCAAPCMNGGAGSAWSGAPPFGDLDVASSVSVAVGATAEARRGRCRPGATARPWACPWCRRCRGCRGRRATASTGGRLGRRPRRARPRTRRRRASSALPESSATWSRPRASGRSARTAASDRRERRVVHDRRASASFSR